MTAIEFIDLVQKSGVVEAGRLTAYLQQLRDQSAMPDEPGKLAGLMVRDAILTLFQAEQLLQGKWKRFTIGKYKVLERLGSGGMGQVFLCEHKFMRRRVAVKVLPTAKAEEEQALERFYREARAAAALDHPNIVRAFDIDQDEALHFLVMEYVDGANLQEIVKKSGPLDVTRACHYIYQSAVGLQYAYERGLIHRDIKPGNVLVDRAGMVKILDMGLARFFNDEEDLLTKKYEESVLGTADYLAPEQAIDSHEVDIRADIYSLGATFYFLLAGQPPFAEGTVAQKLIWHQTKQPKPVRLLRPDVPADVAALVERMMAKDPAARYQTPAEVAHALAQYAQTPIAPPSEDELTQLSPAAVAAGGGPPAASGYSSGRFAGTMILFPGQPVTTPSSSAVVVPGARAAVATPPATPRPPRSATRQAPAPQPVAAPSRETPPPGPAMTLPAAVSHPAARGRGGYNPFASLITPAGKVAAAPVPDVYATAADQASSHATAKPARRRGKLLAAVVALGLLAGGGYTAWHYTQSATPRGDNTGEPTSAVRR